MDPRIIPKRVACGGQNRGAGGREGRGEEGGGGGRRRAVGGSGRDYPDGVSGGKSGGGSHVADRGADTEREGVVQGDWVCGGHLEGRGGDPKLPAHGRDQVT